MDNIGFVVDEQLQVLKAVVYHDSSCPQEEPDSKDHNKCVEGCPAGQFIYVYGSLGMARNILNSGPYIQLGEVYRITTLPKKNSIKTRFLSGKARKSLEPLFDHCMDTDKLTDCMDDIELRNVQLQIPSARRFSDGACKVRVRTDTGEITVAVQGDRSKPAILTYNDIGLNYKSFQTFFNYVDMRVMMENFCVYHVTAPGQEEGAPTLPDDYVFPTMDELAHQINYLLGFFAIRSFIGFGVGAGANILARFALVNPQKVEALALINCTSSQAGWIEWAYQKMHSRTLRHSGMTQPVIDYLIWYHFGRLADERNHDLTYTYRTYFSKSVNPLNLARMLEAYVARSDLGIGRGAATLRVPVLNITAALSPHVDDTVTLNGRLDPTNSTWMKISDCGMVLEEQPGKISEAFRLFLQGEGYVAPVSPTKMVVYRRVCESGRRRACRHSPVIRITENPISEAVAC